MLSRVPQGLRDSDENHGSQPAAKPIHVSFNAPDKMKITSCIIAVLLLAQTAGASLTENKIAPNEEHPDRKNSVWLRNGVEILMQTPISDQGFSLCIIYPFGLFKEGNPKGGAGLIIGFTNNRISVAYDGPALKGYSFAIDDFTRDGIPDFIQIRERKTNKIIEAYSISKGIVEPLPDDLFPKDRSEIYYNPEIVDYLKSKIKEKPAGEPEPATTAVTSPAAQELRQPAHLPHWKK